MGPIGGFRPGVETRSEGARIACEAFEEHGIWRLGRSVLELSEVPARVALGDLMTRLLWGALVEEHKIRPIGIDTATNIHRNLLSSPE
jgi:hypothetical protein